ncbi:MAG: cytochrome P450 [Ilumatobacteraceae bacterium]
MDKLDDAPALLRAAMLSEDGRRDPYPYLSALHAHGAATMMDEGYLAVWGYAASTDLMRSPAWGRKPPDPTIRATWQHSMTSEQRAQLRDEDAPDLGPWLQLMDGQEHVHQRMTVNKAFSPKRLAVMRDRIEERVNELCDAIVPGEPFDFIEMIAYPLPTTMIGELVGLPLDRRGWFAERAGTQRSERDPASTFDQLLLAVRARRELAAYVEGLTEERRRHPAGDLLTDLLAVMDSGEITKPQMLALVLMMYLAGHSTTAHMLGNGLHALVSNPEQMDLLRADRSLVKRATEEFLRYDTMVVSVDYRAQADTVVDGIDVPSGTPAHVFLGAANRDPAVFNDPDSLDVARDEGGHISFGAGPHFCLGAALARLESDVAFNALLDRFATIELVEDMPPRADSFNYRSFTRLPVVVHP